MGDGGLRPAWAETAPVRARDGAARGPRSAGGLVPIPVTLLIEVSELSDTIVVLL